jgi:hypothetical protein
MDFMTRDVFDTLIIGVIIIGLVLAAWRLHDDFTRPLPDNRPDWSDEDTAEHQPVVDIDQDTEE